MRNPEKARATDRQYRLNNLDKYQERDRKRDAQPTRSQYKVDYSKQYNIDNHETLTIQRAEYARKHPEVFRESNKRWSAKNQEKVKQIKRDSEQRRKARKKNLDATFTDAGWLHALEYWGYRCAYCGKPAGLWHILAQDHFVPVSKGGAYTSDNILPACHAAKDGEDCCNNLKCSRDPNEWLTSRFGPKRAKTKIAEITAYFDSLEL